MKWNKCSDQMPNLEENVLVYDSYSGITTSFLYDINKDDRKRARTRKDKYPVKIEWFERDCDMLMHITHWMKIPDMPNEVD